MPPRTRGRGSSSSSSSRARDTSGPSEPSNVIDADFTIQYDEIYGDEDDEQMPGQRHVPGDVDDQLTEEGVQRIINQPPVDDTDDETDEETEDEEYETEDSVNDEDEFEDDENPLEEEDVNLARRLHFVEPLYNRLPDGFNATADSYPWSGETPIDRFDPLHENLRHGRIFKDKAALVSAVKEWSIKNNRQFRVSKGNSNHKCWEVFCKHRDELGCGWKLRGSKQARKNDLWEIVTYPCEHSCIFTSTHADHPNLNAGLISAAVAHLVADNPSIKTSTIIAEIKKLYEVKIAYNKAWYAKQITVAKVFGDWEKSYAKVSQLLLAIRQTNPGTIIHRVIGDVHDGKAVLKRLFWTFGPSLEGFQYCRPVLSIDATHLYGKYAGKLLIALGVDANGQIFPLAFGLVQQETKVNWGWFLKKLRGAIGDRRGLCLISDRYAGIIAAINDAGNGWAEPLATHRFCLRHIRSNFHKKFKNNTLKSMVYNAGSEIEKRKFEALYAEIQEISVPAWQWLEQLPNEQWTLAYDEGRRYGSCTTNLVECFNGVLLSGRNLPLCAMVMLIFHRLVNYFLLNRDQANRMSHINRHGITDKGLELTEDSMRHSFKLNVAQMFNRQTGEAWVNSTQNNFHPVVLQTRTCGCGSWACYRVPCGHAICVCQHLHLDHLRFVDRVWKVETYKLQYTPEFHPLIHRDYWPQYDGPILVPQPGTKRKIGRPQSTRFRMEMDERSTVIAKHCSMCGETGHDRRRCNAPNMVGQLP